MAKKLMLSDFIEKAQSLLSEHGDMAVWLTISVAGYEFNSRHTGVAYDQEYYDSDPEKRPLAWPESEGVYGKAFMISGG